MSSLRARISDWERIREIHYASEVLFLMVISGPTPVITKSVGLVKAAITKVLKQSLLQDLINICVDYLSIDLSLGIKHCDQPLFVLDHEQVDKDIMAVDTLFSINKSWKVIPVIPPSYLPMAQEICVSYLATELMIYPISDNMKVDPKSFEMAHSSTKWLESLIQQGGLVLTVVDSLFLSYPIHSHIPYRVNSLLKSLQLTKRHSQFTASPPSVLKDPTLRVIMLGKILIKMGLSDDINLTLSIGVNHWLSEDLVHILQG